MNKDLVEIIGLSKLPKNLITYSSFYIKGEIPISNSKIKLIQINITSKILDYKIVNTPIGKNINNKILTGKKALIDSKFDIILQYLELKSKNIFSEKFSLYSLDALWLPKNTILFENLNINIFIDNIYYEITDKIQIQISFILSSN